MKSLTRSSMDVHVERMEIGVRNPVSKTSRMLNPSMPRKYWMFQPATVIQSYLATSCRFGSEALNIPSTQSDSPNVIRLVISAVQRKASFLSLGTKNRINIPTSGKNVSRVRGCRKKFIFNPRCFSRRVQDPVGARTGDYFKIRYPMIRTTPSNTDKA